MTEDEWLPCADPDVLLEHLKSLGFGRTGGGKRRLRLFACACCRRIWDWLDDISQRAIEVGEQYADGNSSDDDLARAAKATLHRGWSVSAETQAGQAVWACHNAVRSSAPPKRAEAVVHLVGSVIAGEDRIRIKKAARAGLVTANVKALNVEEVVQCDLLRCVFRNPFRSLTLAASHRTPTVVSLAQAAYDERHLPSGELDPHPLAVLSDALEEAGATGEILDHLRSPGPHVRGCFAVDLCLGLT